MVDEVVFKEGFIYSLLNYIDRAKIYLFIITTIVFMVAVYLVYATVRLIINSRMNEFETMKLVGAKLATIKIPVVLNGLIAGLISGLLAFIIFIFFQDQIKSIGSLIKLVNENMLIYLMVIFLTGPLLVILVSVFTLRKVSLNI
jgi:cell division transport system permease protein